MNLTQFSISRNRVSLSILGVVILFGLVLYPSLSRDSMPPYTVRIAPIVTSFPGASPERVEELVTDKIEKVAQELPELKEVTSTSRAGLSVVQVELKMETAPEDLQAVWDRLRRKLDNITDLPENVVPNLDDDGVGEVFGIALGLTSDGYSYAELKTQADDIKDEIIKLKDAAKVELNGVQDERVFVEFDNAKLKTYGLTSNKLQGLISNTNILNSGGEINVEDERIILEPTGNFNSIEEIENMLIPIGDEGQVLALKDITEVKKGYIEPPKQVVRINGKEAISLHVSLIEGASVTDLGVDIDVLVNRWQEKLPVGMELKRIASIDTYINDKISSFISNLVQAILIVLAVMLFFLGLRTGLVISSLIPIVTIATLMVMGLIGMGLNQITLAALIMALGMMVDNGIVVSESIIVKMEGGDSATKAAIDSCSELFTPLLISTLTTSAAFLSFYLAQSTMGDIMGPLFVVISIALIASWIISLSTITLFCVFFLKVKKPDPNKVSFLDKLINSLKVKYKDIILLALARKKLMLLSILGLLIVALWGFGKLPFVFFPDSDRNLITLDINLPEGTKIETTQKTVAAIGKYMTDSLMTNETRLTGVVDYAAFIGEGPSSYDLGYDPDEANSNYAHILVNTTSFLENAEMIDRLDTYCFNNFPNADIKVGSLASGGGGTPVEFKVSGDDPDKLTEIAVRIKEQLTALPFTKNIKDDWGPKSKKFVIAIDQTQAQITGITNQDIALSLQTVLDGFKAGEYREDDQSIPIVMQGNQGKEQSLASLETLNVFSQSTGNSVPLLQVARIVPQWQYASIKRLDITKSIVVSSELTEGGNAAEVVKAITPWLDEQMVVWGDGYSYTLGGDAQNSEENMGAIVSFLPLSAFIIMMLLIIQFNSYRKMLMVLTTIPLGVIGMVLGLFIFRVPFGFMAFLGVISLAGIVINNAIVLVDRIEVEENIIKRPAQDAIIAACLQRFRPILLATFTTVLGLIPLYLGGGEMWEPMAVTIMVGLLFGTVVTLLFIPAFYSVLYKVDYKGYVFNDEILADL